MCLLIDFFTKFRIQSLIVFYVLNMFIITSAMLMSLSPHFYYSVGFVVLVSILTYFTFLDIFKADFFDPPFFALIMNFILLICIVFIGFQNIDSTLYENLTLGKKQISYFEYYINHL